MYCVKCGTKNFDGAVYCMGCGQRLSGHEAVTQVVDMDVVNTVLRKMQNARWIWIFVIILQLFLCELIIPGILAVWNIYQVVQMSKVINRFYENPVGLRKYVMSMKSGLYGELLLNFLCGGFIGVAAPAYELSIVSYVEANEAVLP